MNINEKLRDILRYILIQYPYPIDLNKTRLTKLVYLIDWEMAQRQKEVISGINWYFDNYGPYVQDVMKEAVSDEHIKVNEGLSIYGGPKYTFQIKDLNLQDVKNLNRQEREIIDDVIKSTQDLSFNNFINYIYNTLPVLKTPQYEFLDLVKIASESVNNQ